MRTRWLFSSLVLSLALAGAAVAAIPHLIRYQGTAVDANGIPLEGPYNLTFRLYDAATAGTVVWTETQPAVQLTGGHFSVLLGQATPLNVNWSVPLWLGVQVGTDSELSPRQQITSVPMAIMAERLAAPITPALVTPQGAGSGLDADLLDGLHATAFSQLGSTVESTEIADGTITDADIAPAAAIAGTKINPNFGSQTIATTGNAQIDGTIRGGTYGFGGAFIHFGSTGTSCLQANPFTGGCSCPSGFSPVYLDVTEGRALGICVR